MTKQTIKTTRKKQTKEKLSVCFVVRSLVLTLRCERWRSWLIWSLIISWLAFYACFRFKTDMKIVCQMKICFIGAEQTVKGRFPAEKHLHFRRSVSKASGYEVSWELLNPGCCPLTRWAHLEGKQVNLLQRVMPPPHHTIALLTNKTSSFIIRLEGIKSRNVLMLNQQEGEAREPAGRCR